MAGSLKVASFTVRATMAQSVAWKRAADGEGHASVGTWLAEAADRHLDAVRLAGKPLSLAWRKARFYVRLLDGSEVEVSGKLSPPFGVYWGTEEGPERGRRELYTLVYVPHGRPLGTFRTSAHCRALASELARLWVRWGGSEPAEDPAPLLQRFQREDV
jgi:hypothetical protein